MENQPLPLIYDDGKLLIADEMRHVSSVTPSRSDSLYILFVQSGRMQLYVNSETVELDPLHLLIAAPGVRLSGMLLSPDFVGMAIGIRTTLLSSMIQISGSMIDRMLYVGTHPVVRLGTSKHLLLEHYLAILSDSIRRKSEPYIRETLYHAVSSLLYELFVSACSVKSDTVCLQHCGTQSERLFKTFLQQIAHYGSEERRVSFYADKLNVTPKHLSAVCKSVSGKTALRLIDESAIRRIQHLLLSSDYSIKEISVRMKFPSLSFFGKYVRRHLGVSPTEYRRRYRSM